jgi:hypothetical protein
MSDPLPIAGQASNFVQRNQMLIITIVSVCAGILLLSYFLRVVRGGNSSAPPSASSSPTVGQYHLDRDNSKVNDNAFDRMNKAQNTTQDGCRDQCERTDWCQVWQHDSTNNMCQLYHLNGSFSEADSLQANPGTHVGVFERRSNNNAFCASTATTSASPAPIVTSSTP